MTILSQPYSDFDPRQYLNEYYADFPPENLALLQFLIRAFADVPSDALALDFGSGPTLFSPIAGAHRVREMHVCEYLPANRSEVSAWLSGQHDAFDWTPTLRTALSMEGLKDSPDVLRARETLIRERVTQVIHCDLMQDYPLEDVGLRGAYDVLVSNLCAEAVATDVEAWAHHITKFADLLKPGGRLILSAVKQSRAYSVGAHTFRVLPLTEADVVSGLHTAGFVPSTIQIDHAAATHPVHPYDGLIFATARKP